MNWAIYSGQNEKLTSDSCFTSPNYSRDNISRFLGDFEFLFLFFISQIKSLRNMSALRLNSGPRKETKYFAILRQISPNYARLRQSPYARLRKMAKDCARWRKMAQDCARWRNLARFPHRCTFDKIRLKCSVQIFSPRICIC